MKGYDLVKMSAETKKRPEPGTLFDIAMSDVSPEVMETFEDRESALEALKAYKSHATDMSGYWLTEAYAVESYEVDEDGEFVAGSDYDTAEETTMERYNLPTIEDIAAALTEYQSFEPDTDGQKGSYYLHFNIEETDGTAAIEIVGSHRDAEYTVTAERDLSEFEGDETLDRLYETETLDNADFRQVCEDIQDEVEKVLEAEA